MPWCCSYCCFSPSVLAVVCCSLRAVSFPHSVPIGNILQHGDCSVTHCSILALTHSLSRYSSCLPSLVHCFSTRSLCNRPLSFLPFRLPFPLSKLPFFPLLSSRLLFLFICLCFLRWLHAPYWNMHSLSRTVSLQRSSCLSLFGH